MPLNRYQLAYQKNLRFIREAKEKGNSPESLDLQKQKKDSALTKPIVGLGTEDKPDPERAKDENVALDENWLGKDDPDPRTGELEEFLEKVQDYTSRDKPGMGNELKDLRMLLNKSDWKSAATMIKTLFPKKFGEWTEEDLVRGIVGWRERLSKEWSEKQDGYMEEMATKKGVVSYPASTRRIYIHKLTGLVEELFDELGLDPEEPEIEKQVWMYLGGPEYKKLMRNITKVLGSDKVAEIVRRTIKDRNDSDWGAFATAGMGEETSRQQAWKQSRDRKDERQDEIEDKHLHECGPSDGVDPLGPVTVPVDNSTVTQPEEQEEKWEGAPGARDDVKVVPVLVLQMSEAHGYQDLMEAATKSGHKFYKKTPEPQKPVSLKDLFKDD